MDSFQHLSTSHPICLVRARRARDARPFDHRSGRSKHLFPYCLLPGKRALETPIVSDAPRLIETERLILRCPTSSDGTAVNEAIRESWSELSFWMDWAQGDPPPVSDTAQRMGQRPARFDDHSDFSYAAFERDSGRFIGMFSLFEFDWSVPKGEIGYWLRTSATGLGYATEATLALTTLGMERLNFARIEIRCDALNLCSRAVAERSGFRARRRSEKRMSQFAREPSRHGRVLSHHHRKNHITGYYT